MAGASGRCERDGSFALRRGAVGSVSSRGPATFWSPDGCKLESYSFINSISVLSSKAYFAGELVAVSPPPTIFGPLYAPVFTDRLGSVRRTGSEPMKSYFPYGQERVVTANGEDKFATYYRDPSGLDYADQRYFSSQWGGL